ncbi:hypothetical protein ABT330_25390 [Streptomyces sp. NPDC000658]|uniref:hypothetical protein n=1 Tax=Streptomyces sp. NPDC000658 TaxID=3154266 RepID=UPI00332285EE
MSLLGAVAAVATVVVAAPAAIALGEGCLATAPVCAAEIAEMATGGASGGSLTVGSAAAAAGAKGINLMDEGDVFGEVAAAKTSAKAGYYDVIIHGSKTDFGSSMDAWEKGTNISHRVLAQILRQDEGWTGGPIRLISCNTGSCGATAAQNLSNKLGVQVLAPTEKVWIFGNGRLRVSDKSSGKLGEWKLFEPGGNK